MSCVFRFDGELIYLVAEHNFSPEGADVYRQTYPLPPAKDKLLGAALCWPALQLGKRVYLQAGRWQVSPRRRQQCER
jgi:hypothetical protein